MDNLVTKMPPYSSEAEQAVLAAAMIDAGVMGLVADILEPRHFYQQGHGLIFGALRRLAEAGDVVDLLTVKDALGERLDEAGGWAYLLDLYASVPTTANAESYARIVRDKATLRGLIAAGSAIAQGAFEPGVSAEEAHAQAVAMISGLEVGDGERDDDMSVFLEGYMARVEERGSVAGGVHLESGWHDVNHVWTAARGDLVLLAARPAMGKTAWALNYAWHVAQTARVDFWSLEMDRDRLTDRLVVMMEGVDPARLKAGKLTEDEWKAMARAVGRIGASGLNIRKPNKLTAAGVRRATLKAQARGKGPALVVVDYLGLMDHPRADRHDLAVAATSRALKLFAGEAKVAVLALAQLNRAADKNDTRRPALTNLRDSGALEQDADAVLFLHREAYYDPKAEQEGACEVIVAKHRNGSIGTVPLHFKPGRQLFIDPPPDLPPLGDEDAPAPDWRWAS